MKHCLFIPLLLSLSLFSSFTFANSAPSFTLADYKTSLNNAPAETRSLTNFHGKVVYLDFWASWCKPCRTSFPWMNKMQNKYASQGFEVVSINLDQDISAITKFLEKYPASFHILLDPDGVVAERYELVGMPSSYLIDKKGELRKTHTGFFIKNEGQYEQEIIQLIAE